MSQAERLRQMLADFTLGRWHVLLSLVSIGAVIALATMPQLLGDQVTEAFHGLMEVSPAWLWLAALSFATALAASGCALALGALPLRRRDHARGRERAVRGRLARQRIPPRQDRERRPVRPLRARAAHRGPGLDDRRRLRVHRRGPRDLARAPARLRRRERCAAVVAARAACARGRDRGRHRLLRARLAPRARASRTFSTRSACSAGPRGSRAARRLDRRRDRGAHRCRDGIAAAFGVERPLLAALLVVPALDLAGILPITPGNIGVASAAVAFALHAHGAPAGTAFSAGIAFSAVETVTCLAFGTGSALYLAGSAPGATRRWTAATAAAAACLGLGGRVRRDRRAPARLARS